MSSTAQYLSYFEQSKCGAPSLSAAARRFLASSRLTGDVSEVPGMTAVGANKLAAAGVTSTQQLLGAFLLLAAPGRSLAEIKDAFLAWMLAMRCPACFKDTVVEAVASKACLSFPALAEDSSA